MVTSWTDEIITCINCGSEYDRRDTDNYLEICQSCQINIDIKREEEIRN